MKVLLKIFFIIIVLNANAQTPNWSWAKISGGIQNQYVAKSAIDSQGNSIIYGGFNESISFDNIVLTSQYGSHAQYIAKFDQNGNCLWLKKIEAYNSFSISDINIDNDDNIVISGNNGGHVSSIDFNNGAHILNILNKGSFIVKYNPAGNIAWSKTKDNSSYYDNLKRILAIGNDLYGIGTYKTSITIGGITLTSNEFDASKIFIVKYNANGNVVWAKSFGELSNYFEVHDAIRKDSNNNLIITGFFNTDSIVFGNFTLNQIENSAPDQFFVEIDSNNGNAISAINSNISADLTGSFKLQKNHLYYFGYFNTPTFNVQNITLNKIGITDGYIAKYDLNGNILWARNYGYTNNVTLIDDVVEDNQGNLFIGADSSCNNCTFGTSTIMNNGSCSSIIGKTNNVGDPLWAKNTISQNANQCNWPVTLTMTNNGKIFTSGIYNYTDLTFDNINLAYNNISGASLDLYKVFYASIDTNNLQLSDFTNDLVKVYPNPANNYIQITNLPEGTNNYSIVDATGRLVSLGTLTLENRVIEIEKLSKGIYFLRISNMNSIKFIKE